MTSNPLSSTSSEHLQALAEITPEWIWKTDKEGRVVYSNPKATALLGQSLDVLIGTSVYDLLVDKEREAAQRTLQAAMADGTSFCGLILEFKTIHGTTVLLETYGVSLRSIGQDGLICGSRDVTALVKAERESQLKEFYLDNMPTFVGVTDLEGTLTFCNRVPLKSIGLTRDEVIGRKFSDIPWWTHSPELQASIEDIVAQVAQGKEIVVEHDPMLGDQLVPVKTTGGPLRDENGEIFALLFTGTPIVEQRQATKEAQERLRTIERQAVAISQLSAPVLKIWDSVLVLPIIGEVDSNRSADMMAKLLSEVVDSQARYVILDVTGVQAMDTQTSNRLIKMALAAQFIGAKCILTGISPAVAQTLVQLGVDLSGLVTMRNLKAGLHACLQEMQSKGKVPVSGR